MDEAADLVERFMAAWNRQDGDLIRAVCHDDTERISPFGTVRGCDALVTYAERFWRFAPESHHSVPHWASHGNLVLYELEYDGVHSGPLATPAGEIQGSGHHFRIAAAGVLEIHDGGISAERIYFDTAAFLRQLGLAS